VATNSSDRSRPVTLPTFDPKKVDYATKRVLNDLAKGINLKTVDVDRLSKLIASMPIDYTLDQIRNEVSAHGSHPLLLSGLLGTPQLVAGGGNPPEPPPVLVCYMDVNAAQFGGPPAAPNKRWMRGDFCGIHVDGLPSTVDIGGPNDATLVTCFQYGAYDPGQRQTILDAYQSRGYTHMVLSWPDLRERSGYTPANAVECAQEIKDRGMYVVWFLLAKDFDDPGNIAPSVDPIINAALSAGVYDIACIGWELSLWMSPTQVQDAIDYISAYGTEASGHNLYVHFQEGYPSFQQPGGTTADFWNPNQGKLTGLLYQKVLAQDCGLWQAVTNDIQVRFAGGFGFFNDSGFGHPWDIVQYEYSASFTFYGLMTESQAQTLGQQGISSPPTATPSQGDGVQVYGFMNAGPNV
jgi:hypothetical protein